MQEVKTLTKNLSPNRKNVVLIFDTMPATLKVKIRRMGYQLPRASLSTSSASTPGKMDRWGGWWW